MGVELKNNNDSAYREKMSTKKGRPSSFGPALSRKIYRALIKGNSFQNACRLSGISVFTYNSWMAEGVKHRKVCNLELQDCRVIHEREAAFTTFSIHCEIAIGLFSQRCSDNIVRQSRTELRPNTFLLERRFPQEWGAVQEINVTSHSVIEHVELKNVDSKQRMLMSDALKRRALLQSGEVMDAEIITQQDPPVLLEES